MLATHTPRRLPSPQRISPLYNLYKQESAHASTAHDVLDKNALLHSTVIRASKVPARICLDEVTQERVGVFRPAQCIAVTSTSEIRPQQPLAAGK